MTKLQIHIGVAAITGFVFSIACGSDSKSSGAAPAAGDNGSTDQQDPSIVGAPSGKGGAANFIGQSSQGGSSMGGSTGVGGSASGAPLQPAGPPIAAGPDAGAPVPNSVPQIVNPFTLTAHDPLSTFGADVDTASYDQFQRDVTAGYLPSPDIVRT